MAAKGKKEAEDLESLRHEIKILISIINKTAKADLEKRLKKEKIDMSPLAFSVMKILSYSGMTSAQLAKKMMLAPPTLIPVIDYLDDNGFINRVSDKSDRRTKELRVTLKGKTVLGKVGLVAKEDSLAKSIALLGNSRSAALAKLLEEVVETMSGKELVEEVRSKCFTKDNIESDKKQ